MHNLSTNLVLILWEWISYSNGQHCYPFLQFTNCGRQTHLFRSVQSLDQLGHWGYIRDDSAEILFQSFLQEVLVSSSCMGRDVHSLMLSFQHFLCRPQRRPPSKVPWRMVLERGFVVCDMLELCKFLSLDSCQVDSVCKPQIVLAHVACSLASSKTSSDIAMCRWNYKGAT